MKSQHQGIYKVIYLLLLSTGLFFINDWVILAGLFIFQCLLWLFTQSKIKPLIRALLKLKWFYLIIIISYALISPGEGAPSIALNLYAFSVDIYPSGIYMALLMITRVSLMLMTSLWVRLSSSQEQFIGALNSLKIPPTVAIVIDLSLSQMSKGKEGKNKKEKAHKKNKTNLSFEELKTNKTGFIDNLIKKNQQKSDQILQQNYPDMEPTMRKDVLIILSVVVAIMSLKLLQMLPGLPFAPGHKNLIIIPLIMLASLSTNSKYGGFAAGFATGMVSFFMGFGKFGVLEILHFALPGLVADFLTPLIQHAKGKMVIVKLVLMGAVIGLTRFVANFSVLILAGSPKLAWVVFFPMLISQIIFGALSSLVCLIVIKKHFNGGWFK